MNKVVTEQTTCRLCGRYDLVPLLSLGEQYAVAFLESPDEPSVRAPLELIFCDPGRGGCALVQLRHTVDHDLLYRRYWYRSSISTTMVTALAEIAAAAERIAALQPGDLVVDIGCNDGTLLRQYTVQGLEKIGFEPSNLWTLAMDAGHIIHDYFHAAPFLTIATSRRARVITSIAMFYDLEDPNTFVRDIVQCLARDGVWIVQMNYLGLMIENVTFDNISHEHLEYYSFAAMERLLARHGLEVMDAELNDVNGGSIRFYIRHVGSAVRPFEGAEERIARLRDHERELGLECADALSNFARRIERIREELRRTLEMERRAGRRIYIYGASTRGLVVLQYAGITADWIPLAVDKNPDKAGRYIAGTGIRCISLEQYRADPPDLLFVLPYQFQREIMLQEAEFLRRGGRMLFAIPEVRVVGGLELAALEEGAR